MGWEEPASISREIENVTVTKRIEESEFSIPAIEFRIRAPAEREGTLRLCQPIPDDIPTEAVRFHTNYNSFQWSVVDGDASYEMDLRSDETVRTVIGIDTDEPQAVRRMCEAEMALSIQEDEAEDRTAPADPGKKPIDEGDESEERDEPGADDSAIRAGTTSTRPESIEGVFDEEYVEADAIGSTEEPMESEAPDSAAGSAAETETVDRSTGTTVDSEHGEPDEDDEEPLPETAGASQEEIEMRLGGGRSVSDPTQSGSHPRSQPESQLETQPESQSESQPESQSVSQPESQSESQSVSQPEAQPESQSESQSGSQPESQPENQPEADPRERREGPPGEVPKTGSEPEGESSPATGPSALDEGNKNLGDFIREVQQGRVSDDELRVLRELFTTEIRGRESIDARIRHLQAEVSDLAAYKSAMGEFLHAHDSGDSIVDRLEGQMSELSGELAALEETTDTHGDQLGKLASNQKVFDRRQQDNDEAIERLQRTLNDLDARLDQLETRLDELDVDERVSSVEGEVSELTEWREQMRSVFR